jgi:hypothetical protein
MNARQFEWLNSYNHPEKQHCHMPDMLSKQHRLQYLTDIPRNMMPLQCPRQLRG